MNSFAKWIGSNSSFIALSATIICSPVFAQTTPVTPPNPPVANPEVEVSISVPRHRGVFSEGAPEKISYTATCPKFVFDISASKIQESNDRAFVEAEIAKIPSLEEKWEDYKLCLKTNFDLDRNIVKDNINSALTAYVQNDKVYGDDVYNAIDAQWQVILKNEKAKKTITEEPYVSNWKAPAGVFKGYFTGAKPEEVKYIATCPAYQPEVTAQTISQVQTRARLIQIIDVIKAQKARREAHADCRQKQAIEDFMSLQKSIVDSFSDVTWKPEVETYLKKLDVLNNVVAGLKMPGGILGPKAVAKPMAPKPAAKPTKTKKKI